MIMLRGSKKIYRRMIIDWGRQVQVLDQDLVLTGVYRILYVLTKLLTNLIR